MARASAAARGIPSAMCRGPIDGTLCEFGLAWFTSKRRQRSIHSLRGNPILAGIRIQESLPRGITSASRAKPEALCPFYPHLRLIRWFQRAETTPFDTLTVTTLVRIPLETQLETKIRFHLGYARY